MPPSHSAVATVVLPFVLLSVAGCRVSRDNSDGKGGNNVKVVTPFGGMQIKTDEAATQATVGLPIYPGATLVQKQRGHDNGAADINIGFGSFRMRVKAVSYQTSDSADKVQAFYRNALRRYGDVIQCSGGHPVGKPDHTAEGLTCGNDGDRQKFSVDEGSSSEVTLKAGSRHHQHAVSFAPEGNGAKFSIIALDLPETNPDTKGQNDSED